MKRGLCLVARVAEPSRSISSISCCSNYLEVEFVKTRFFVLVESGPTVPFRWVARRWNWPGNIRELENFLESAVIVTRGRSLEAPLGELQKTNTVAFPDIEQTDRDQVAGDTTGSQNYKAGVAAEYERKQRDEIIRALMACRGFVGGAYGAAARLGVNRTTLLWRMKKYGLYAKQYAYPERASSSSPHP